MTAVEIHRYEKGWLIVALLFIVGLVATVVYGAVGAGVNMVGDRGNALANPEDPAESPDFREPGVYCTDDRSECDAYVLARRFFFQPGTAQPIQIPAGSNVTFHLASPDVLHGFQVVGTNVNVMAVPGQAAVFSVTFDDTGEYDVVCNEYCGSGHHTMEGRIEVVPPAEFEGEES